MSYDKIQGELLKLGYTLDPTTVKNILRRHRLLPASQRGKSSWRTFLKHYRQQMLACDFFTIETLHLPTLYVFFFIELGLRHIHLAGCTANPDNAWITQQARQIVCQLDVTSTPMRFLIHDHDHKFTTNFDQVFISEGINIVLMVSGHPMIACLPGTSPVAALENSGDIRASIEDMRILRVLQDALYKSATVQSGLLPSHRLSHKFSSSSKLINMWSGFKKQGVPLAGA